MSRSRPGPCARKTLHRRAGRGAPLAVAVEEPPNEPMKNWEERARFMDAFDACCLYELDPSDIALCARTCCWGRRSNGDQEYSVQHVRAWTELHHGLCGAGSHSSVLRCGLSLLQHALPDVLDWTTAEALLAT